MYMERKRELLALKVMRESRTLILSGVCSMCVRVITLIDNDHDTCVYIGTCIVYIECIHVT